MMRSAPFAEIRTRMHPTYSLIVSKLDLYGGNPSRGLKLKGHILLTQDSISCSTQTGCMERKNTIDGSAGG